MKIGILESDSLRLDCHDTSGLRVAIDFSVYKLATAESEYSHCLSLAHAILLQAASELCNASRQRQVEPQLPHTPVVKSRPWRNLVISVDCHN